jgi:4-hydroxybenzoate polyprenyltransferase
MLGVLKKLRDFFIHSNLFIAVAAVLLTMEAQVLLGIRPELHPYLFLVFFATMFEYNLHKFVAVFFYKQALLEPKFRWISKNLKLFYFIFFASVTGFIIAASFAKWQVLVALFPLGLITFLYSFPVYKKGKKIFRLREVPLAKIFIISFVWSATSIVLPAVHAGLNVSPAFLWLMITERSLFIFAITVPFDIRDMKSDNKAGLKTLPLMLGENKAWLIAKLSIIIFTFATCIRYTLTYEWHFIPAFLISGLSTLYFISDKKIRRLDNYHYGVLDGTMALQGILVLICWWFSHL